MALTAPNIEAETRIRRLRYRSHHRGCKESDLILGQFCERVLDSLTPEQIDIYEQLLEEDDTYIWKWLNKETEIPTQYIDILDKIRANQVVFE